MRAARDGYVARTPPLPGEDQAERKKGETLGDHRFKDDSDSTQRKQLSLLKLDRRSVCRHTRTTVNHPTRALELVSPLPRLFGALGMFIVVVILILPR